MQEEKNRIGEVEGVFNNVKQKKSFPQMYERMRKIL